MSGKVFRMLLCSTVLFKPERFFDLLSSVVQLILTCQLLLLKEINGWWFIPWNSWTLYIATSSISLLKYKIGWQLSAETSTHQDSTFLLESKNSLEPHIYKRDQYELLTREKEHLVYWNFVFKIEKILKRKSFSIGNK